MVYNDSWTDPELLILRESVQRNIDNEDIRKLLEEKGYKRTVPAIDKKARALGMPNDTERYVLSRIVKDTDEYRVTVADTNEEEPIEELVERAVEKTSREVARVQTRPYAEVQLITKKPIGIAFVSDQHITTHGATNLKLMLEDAELIQQTPGLYCLLGGDGIENHIKHRSALVTSGSTPDEEWRIFNHYLSILGLKALGMISGNHCAWSVAFAGIDMVFEMAQKQKIHYAPDEMIVFLKLVPAVDGPGMEYTVKMRHKARYESSFNLGHAVKRMWEHGDDDFDCGAICHMHPCGGHVESFMKHGKLRWAVRPGSYQIASDYSRAGGFPRSNQTCPTVIFRPDRKEMMAFPDVRQAVEVLGTLRGSLN